MEPEQAKQASNKPPILYVREFPYPGHELYTKEKIESALDYVPEDEDLFIVTYPKSGTTWLTYIAWEILNDAQPIPSMEAMNYRLIPYMEMCGASVVRTVPRPRAFKYHSSYNLVPKSPSAKYIYLYRNPKDVCVSRFFFTQEVYGRELDFDEYFEFFLSGRMAHGSWFDHIASWYEHRFDNNVVFLSYEELLRNTRCSVMKLASFIGESYRKRLDENGDLVDTILKQTSFEYMKAKLPVAVPVQAEPGKYRKLNFFRKAVPGDWKNHLTPAQRAKFDKAIRERLGHTDLLQEFLEN